MLLVLGEQDDLRGFMLEKMSCNTETNASCSAGDDVDLFAKKLVLGIASSD